MNDFRALKMRRRYELLLRAMRELPWAQRGRQTRRRGDAAEAFAEGDYA